MGHPNHQTPILDQRDLVAYLATQPDIVAAYLFGSLAEGRPHPRSDVDIAILLRDASDLVSVGERQLALFGELERFADREVNVVILNVAPPILQHQVLRFGRLLYEGDRMARIEFEVRAGKVYADLKPMYDFFDQALSQEIKEGGLGERRRRRAGAAAAPAK